MHEREAEPDRDAREARGGAFRRGAEDDVEEEERRQRLRQEARQDAVLPWTEFAITVGGEATGHPPRLLAGDEIQHCRRGDGTAYAMVNTVRSNARDIPRKPIPNCGNAAASTALPQPPKVSQNVPKNSAAKRRDILFSPWMSFGGERTMRGQ